MATKAELERQLLTGRLPAWPSHVRAYPGLLTAFLKADAATIGRVYMLARALDDEGRGWLSVQLLKVRLTHQKARSRLFCWRRLRQILSDGEGVCWERDDEGRIYIYAPHRIANALGCGRLRGQPIKLRVRPLRDSIQATKAEFYAAYHSGRAETNPITRATIEEQTGVPESTQRHYEEVAGVEPVLNLAIDEEYSQARLQDAAWEHGGAFRFVDWAGKLGPQGKPYVAYRLPNSYRRCHEQAATGRLRKINRRIDLVDKGAQGNDPDVYRLYFPTADLAAAAYNGDPDRDKFYDEGVSLKSTTARPARMEACHLWGAITP